MSEGVRTEMRRARAGNESSWFRHFFLWFWRKDGCAQALPKIRHERYLHAKCFDTRQGTTSAHRACLAHRRKSKERLGEGLLDEMSHLKGKTWRQLEAAERADDPLGQGRVPRREERNSRNVRHLA